MSLGDLMKSYIKALNSNENAVKNLSELNIILKEKQNQSLEDELKRKIRLLDLRTKVINIQIEKRRKELNDLF
jgi:hypothetical protein